RLHFDGLCEFLWIVRLVGHVQHFTARADLPSVEQAGQRAIIDPRQRQRCAAVRASFIEKSGVSVLAPEGHEVAPEQFYADGSLASPNPNGQHGRQPVVLAQHSPHWRVTGDPAQQLILFPGDHRALPLLTSTRIALLSSLEDLLSTY